jgi:hypothetical protein
MNQNFFIQRAAFPLPVFNYKGIAHLNSAFEEYIAYLPVEGSASM